MQWYEFLDAEEKKDYFKKLTENISQDEKIYTIYPDKINRYRAFDLTPINKVKVVIIGQDPYHTPGKADGLAFSVNYGTSIPPSLVNIYKEINLEFGCNVPHHGNLSNLSKQGVLLLNTALTVIKGKPNSHSRIGWGKFIDNVIEFINTNCDTVVFLLLGNNAKEYKNKINLNKHFIVEAVHPSPFSARRGFFGSGIFNKVNEILEKHNKAPINWTPYEMMFFDLDGTLVDTLDSITYVLNCTLNKYSYKICKEKVRMFIGNGAENMMKRTFNYLNISFDKFDIIMKEFMLNYKTKQIDKLKIYDNMSETLNILSKFFRLGIYTNKPYNVAMDVVDILFPNMFECVLGNIESYDVKPDINQLKDWCDSNNIDSTENIIYVGDSEVDMQTGINAKMKTIGVSWGYNSKLQLQKYKVDRIISHPNELLDEIACNWRKYDKVSGK